MPAVVAQSELAERAEEPAVVAQSAAEEQTEVSAEDPRRIAGQARVQAGILAVVVVRAPAQAPARAPAQVVPRARAAHHVQAPP